MTISNEAVEAAASKAAEVYETLRSYGATAPEAIVAAVDEFQAAAPHLYPASGEVGEAVKRLTDCATNEKAHWSLLPDAGACVDVPVSDLRAVLSALSEATERAGRMERENEDLRLLILGGEDAPGVAASLTFDQVRKAHNEHLSFIRATGDSAQAEATRLKEKLDEAGKVIAPFSEFCREADTPHHDDNDGLTVKLGHLRAALRWTEEASQGEGE